ncbi:nuclear transport factor 2 family protein [Escherichia coli]
MFKSLTSAVVLSLATLGSSVQAQDLPQSPIEVAHAFERHFNAADLDSLTKLYGEGSLFVPAPGVQLQEPAQIRDALTQFMASKVPIKLTVRQVYQAGDTALVVFDWVMNGTGADGKQVDMTGTGADVVVRQADGAWVYAIDNPFGVAQPTN